MAIGRPETDNRSRYTREYRSIHRYSPFSPFAARMPRENSSPAVYSVIRTVKAVRLSEKDRLEYFVRSFGERVNREKGTSIRNGVSFHEIRAKGRRKKSVVSRHRYFFSRLSRRSDGMIISMHGREITSTNECKVMSGVIPMLRQASRRLNAPVQRTD